MVFSRPVPLRLRLYLNLLDGDLEKRRLYLWQVKLSSFASKPTIYVFFILKFLRMFDFFYFGFVILFFLGGYDSSEGVLDLAAKYDGSWENVGSLMQPRRGHRSLVHGSTILHIGGDGE